MKIVAVCGFGVGSSLLLKISIDKVLKSLGYEEEAENTDITTAKSISCDAIFTSVDIADDLREERKDVKIYSVNKYMDVNEVKTVVEHFLNDYNCSSK